MYMDNQYAVNLALLDSQIIAMLKASCVNKLVQSWKYLKHSQQQAEKTNMLPMSCLPSLFSRYYRGVTI